MSSLDPLLVSEFTRDPVAERDSICQRVSCQASVPRGQPYIYVGRKDGKPGRYLCTTCYQRYRDQPTSITLSRDACAPDPDTIRRSIIAAQSRASVDPPAVVPMISGSEDPNRAAITMPPPLQPAGRKGQGPGVFVPSAAWQRRGAEGQVPPPHAALPPNAIGYNSNHQMYLFERDRWARLAYATPPAETITLEISALHESGKRGRHRGTPFGNICEGLKDIDARLTAPELRALALNTIIPCILAFSRQFPWRTEEFIVRDDSWVDLAKYSEPHVPYFYASCLHPSSRKGAKGPVFKSRVCSLSVIVPQTQWVEYQEFTERLQSTAANDTKSTRHRTSQASSKASIQLPIPMSPPGPSSFHTRSSSPAASPQQSLPTPPPLSSPRPLRDRLFLSEHAMTSDSLLLSKRAHHRSGSPSSATTRSPPPKKLAPQTEPYSPNHKDLKEALKFGGGAALDVDRILKQTTQLIDFHPIPTLPLSEIMKPKHHAFNVLSSALYPGQIRVDSSPASLVGVGAFKTAQAGQLILSSPPSSGLGFSLSQDIIAKRPYIRRENLDGKPPFPRYAISDELEKLFREANVLYWAKALMTMTYDFIDHALATTEPPSFDIPRLRFVEAGLALGYANTSGGGGPRSTSRRAGSVSIAYLVEEVIPDTESFVKFVHNGSCLPLLRPNQPQYAVAEFLVFTQHVQYFKTRGLAYISDYQGSTCLLTDPQILTHPSVGDGINIFSDGNLEREVEQFEKEHVCNSYCKWPGFKLARFQSSDGGTNTTSA